MGRSDDSEFSGRVEAAAADSLNAALRQRDVAIAEADLAVRRLNVAMRRGDRYEALLRHCEQVFRRYADLHRAKQTPEGDEKAAANDREADKIREAIR